jgi:hypothetical protein
MQMTLLLFVALLAVTPDKFLSLFLERGQTTLETSAEITLYALKPQSVPLTSRVEAFHGYPILDRVVLRGEEKAKLLGKLYTSIAEDAEPARCFIPRHGIRAVKGDRSVDLVICFECQQVDSYVDGNRGGSTISKSSQPYFDEVMKRQK